MFGCTLRFDTPPPFHCSSSSPPRRSFLANLKRRHRIPFKMQFVMWFAGLRGAIAFALALNMPNIKDEDGNPVWENDYVVTTTLCSA